MSCSMCGTAADPGARFCSWCGEEIVIDAPPSTPSSSGGSSPTEWALTGGSHHYAGFWLRTVAYALDWALIFVAAFLLIFTFVIGVGPSMSPEEMETIGQLFGVVIAWLYFTVAESSTWQATPGKRLLGLRVVDRDGVRIGWWHANGRYWSKILSAVLLWVGFLMVGVTQHKQGLHDLIAGTFVIRINA